MARRRRRPERGQGGAGEGGSRIQDRWQKRGASVGAPVGPGGMGVTRRHTQQSHLFHVNQYKENSTRPTRPNGTLYPDSPRRLRSLHGYRSSTSPSRTPLAPFLARKPQSRPKAQLCAVKGLCVLSRSRSSNVPMPVGRIRPTRLRKRLRRFDEGPLGLALLPVLIFVVQGGLVDDQVPVGVPHAGVDVYSKSGWLCWPSLLHERES